MSSRLGKQVQHKTKQAEKLLQMLKQKREKKKNAQQNQSNIPPQIHIISPVREPNTEVKKNSSSYSNDSFRTCNNSDGCLADLYFKIFSEHMIDPSQGALDLENCLQNMRKQLIKLTEQGQFNKKTLKITKEQAQKAEKAQKQSINVVSKLKKQITDLQEIIVGERKKNQQLMEKKNQAFNNSGVLNSSAIYEGYEEKIKQLSDKLQSKEQQIRSVWDKNRDCQTQIFFLQKKQKNWQRQKEEADKQKQILLELIQKLRGEIQTKDHQQTGINSQVLALKQKQADKLKEKYEKQIDLLRKKIIEEQDKYQIQVNSIKIQIQGAKKIEQKLNKDLIQANKQTKKLAETNEMKTKECKQLQLTLSDTQSKVIDLQSKLISLKQQKNNLELQLSNKIALFSSISDSTSDKIALLMQQKQNLEQTLKDDKAQHEDIVRDLKLKLTQMETNMKKESQKWEKETLRYQNQLSGLSQKNQEMAQQVKGKQIQVNQFINITQQLTEELTNAKQELDEYENRIMIMKEENTQLIQIRENHKKKAEQLQAVVKNMENLLATKEREKQQQNNNLKQKIDSQSLKITELTNINQKLKKQIPILQQQLENQKQKKNQNQQETKRLILEYKNSDEKIVELTKKCNILQEELKEERRKNLQLLAKSSTNNANQLIEQLTSGLKDQLNQRKQTIESLNCEISALKQEISKLSSMNEQMQKQNQIYTVKIKSMAEDKNKDSAKYIKTIEELTQELNEAYRKVNEYTRNNLENKDRDGSKQKNNRGKSVNKLKSYFGFGSKNDD